MLKLPGSKQNLRAFIYGLTMGKRSTLGVQDNTRLIVTSDQETQPGSLLPSTTIWIHWLELIPFAWTASPLDKTSI